MRIRSLFSVAMIAALLAGCGAAATPAGAAATVDGEPIPRERLEDAVRELTGDTAGMDAEERNELVAATQRQVLSFLIQAQTIVNVAEERGFTVDEEAEQARFAQDLEQFGGEEALVQQLAAQGNGLTLEMYRDVLLPASMRLDAIREDLVAPTESRTVRHILVETEPEAQAIVDELGEGADFGELAGERSIDPGSGAQGGELGARPRGSYVPPFDEAVWSAEVGEVVGPVESDFGFHVLEVTETGTLDPSDPSVAQSAQAEIDQLLIEAFSEADITVAAGLGQWDPEVQQVVPPEQVGQGADPGQQPPPGTEQLDEPNDAPGEE